jgi:polysaccharide biosynthesis/export protein
MGNGIMRSIMYAIAFALATAGSSATFAQPVGAVQPIVTAVDTEAPNPDATITPLDHLDITVFREPDLSVQDVTVDESGHVALPLVGDINAAGKSTEIISAEIAKKLREYVKDPQVAVTLKQAASRQVTVTGSVTQPGVYPIQGRMTLMQAVALARGPSQVASLDQTFIFRTRNGQRSAARFNLDAIAKAKANDPEVISGDTISIGSSGLKTAWRDVLDTVRSFNIFRVLP